MGQIVHFETLGCRLNQDESEGAARSFFNAGYSVSMETLLSSAQPDSSTLLCVINTCTVTSKAEQKARRIIRLCLEKFPSALVCVTGCYAELDSNQIVAINPDRVFTIPGTKKYLLKELASSFSSLLSDKGTADMEKIRAFINSFIERKNDAPLILQKAEKKNVPPEFTLYTPVFEKHSRASLKIQDGCNNSCTFCRIHFARGKAVSLPVQDVLERVREIERSGKNEVVFTGVNLSQYAGDFTEDGRTVKKDFAFLLSYLIKNTDSIKFRISSFYPQCVTDELCDALKSDRVQPFFHLSVQSGSDSVLAAMKRPYGHEQVVEAVEKIRRAKSECFISCDIIAGFPGETEEDFNDTVKLCRECAFSWMHVFPFSPRPGTEAAVMKNQVTESIKNERAGILGRIAVESKISYIKSMTGKTFNAIVENSRTLRLLKAPAAGGGRKTYHAVTDNFIHVEFQSSEEFESSSCVKVVLRDVLEDNIRSGKEIECRGELA